MRRSCTGNISARTISYTTQPSIGISAPLYFRRAERVLGHLAGVQQLGSAHVRGADLAIIMHEDQQHPLYFLHAHFQSDDTFLQLLLRRNDRLQVALHAHLRLGLFLPLVSNNEISTTCLGSTHKRSTKLVLIIFIDATHGRISFLLNTSEAGQNSTATDLVLDI